MKWWKTMGGARKLPILIEISQDLQTKIDSFASKLANDGLSSTSGDGNNASFILQAALNRFYMALKSGKVTSEMLSEFQKGYLEHRSAERNRTNTTISDSVVALMPEIANMILALNPELRHVYHGKKINNKLIAYFAIAFSDYPPTA